MYCTSADIQAKFEIHRRIDFVYPLTKYISTNDGADGRTDRHGQTIMVHKGYAYMLYSLAPNTEPCVGGSNNDSLFARTVAYPVQVAYWTKEVIAPCGYSVPCQF